MALRAFLIMMIVAAAAAASPALAADYMVGDNAGWSRDVDYTLWAQGKDFYVGDSIMFMYTQGAHNVIKVNRTEFQQCAYSNTTDEIFTSGNDVLPLAAPGKSWYISGFPDDCSNGMKLVITVSEAEAPAPAPIPGSSTPPPGTSAGGEVSSLKSCVWMLALMAAYRMIMA